MKGSVILTDVLVYDLIDPCMVCTEMCGCGENIDPTQVFGFKNTTMKMLSMIEK